MNQAFEYHVNWRLVEQGFKTPCRSISFDKRHLILPISRIVFFISQDETFDVIALRDWLHNSDHNSSGYQMIGCYQCNARSNTQFIGLKLAFIVPRDAAMFRFAWVQAVCAVTPDHQTHKYLETKRKE